MTPKTYPNRIAAILAAEATTVARGYSDEDARKYCAAFQVRRFGADRDEWEAWYLHHKVENRIHRRPIVA